MPVIDREQQTGGIMRSGTEQMVRENSFLDSSLLKMTTIPDSHDGVLLEPLSMTPDQQTKIELPLYESGKLQN